MENLENTADLKVKLQKRKLKRIILILFAVSAIFLALSIVLFNLPKERTESTDYTDALTNYEFYPVLQENIFVDPDYTEEMRTVNFEDLTAGIKSYILTDENVSSFDPSVQFMYNYINFIINGDEVRFNACFSNAYYEKIYPKGDFTMQRLYDIKLYRVQEYSQDGYPVSVFKLEYKILKNDGTFRRDISSTSSRTKTIYVTGREGRLAIDGEIIQHIQHNEKN